MPVPYSILLGLILPIIGLIQVSSLPQQFFPPVDRDQLQIELELPAFASIEKTKNTKHNYNYYKLL